MSDMIPLEMAGISFVILPVTLSFLIVIALIIYWRRHSLDYLPGPSSGPWSVGKYSSIVLSIRFHTSVSSGNMADFLRTEEGGYADLKWTKEYGTTILTKSTFGVS